MIINAGLSAKCEMGSCTNMSNLKLCLGKKGSVFVCRDCLNSIAKQIKLIKGESSGK